jgi:glucokinase
MKLLAVDVGGTRIKWLAADGRHGELPTPRNGESVIRSVLELRATTGSETVALALPGIIDPDRRIWRYAANLEVRNLPVGDRFAESGVPLHVLINDVAAAAAGEANGESLALLQLGTGVGCRIVQGGQVLDGHSGMPGEIGHLVVEPDGPVCSCGLRGCVEAIAGWKAVRPQLAALGLPEDPAVLIGAETSSAPLAERVFGALGWAAAAIVAVVDPGEVRLGGGLAVAWGDEGASRVAAAMERRLLPDLSRRTRVTVSRLGDSAALHGLRRLSGA